VKLKRIILFILLFLPLGILPAAPFDMILVGDPILQDIRFVSLESGRPFLSFSPPLAPAEVEIFLDSIDSSLLTAPAKEAYYRIRRRLTPRAPISFTTDNFSLFLDINATLEGKARFNQDIAWEPQPATSPLLTLPLRLHFANSVQLYFEPIFSVTPEVFSPHDAQFSHNVPLGYADYEPDMPLRAFLAAGGSWWNFQIGRDNLSWGTGHTGSLSFSDNSTYFDFARLSFFSRSVKYSVVVNQMPLKINNSLYGLDWEKNPEALRSTTNRYFYLHRIDFLFKNRVTLGLMEGAMVGNSPLELRFLNPMMIFHSLFSWTDYDSWRYTSENDNSKADMVGSFFSLELNWHITRAFAFHGQFVMNEFATPGEEEGGDQSPNALGYMAGFSFTHSFNTWASIFFLEFIYTDPYLYILSTPFASFIHMRTIDVDRYYFIGHSRDTITLSLGGRFFKGDTLSFTSILSWIASGEHNANGITWNWTDNPDIISKNRATPTGTAEHKFAATLATSWRPLPRIGFNADATAIVSLNNKHVLNATRNGGQASFSINLRY